MSTSAVPSQYVDTELHPNVLGNAIIAANWLSQFNAALTFPAFSGKNGDALAQITNAGGLTPEWMLAVYAAFLSAVENVSFTGQIQNTTTNGGIDQFVGVDVQGTFAQMPVVPLGQTLSTLTGTAGASLQLDGSTVTDGFYLTDDTGDNTIEGGDSTGLALTNTNGPQLLLSNSAGDQSFDLTDGGASGVTGSVSCSNGIVTISSVHTIPSHTASIVLTANSIGQTVNLNGAVTFSNSPLFPTGFENEGGYGDSATSPGSLGQVLGATASNTTLWTTIAGQATITSGNTTIAVSYASAGTGQPVVVVTPTSSTALVAYVTYSGSAGAWTGFTIHIPSTLVSNATFNYLVVAQP
jgi:hypothetical protein